MSWVFRIFYKAYFYSYRFCNCFFKCFNSFYFYVILFISYLLSKFLRSRAISALFFWILDYCSLNYFFNYNTRSSYSAGLGATLFFFLYFYFSTISSILLASSLSWPFNLVCCYISLVLLHNNYKYIRIVIVICAYFLFFL